MCGSSGLYFRPERRCLTGAGAGPIGTGDVCELLNCTDSPWKLGKNGTDRGLYGGVYTGVLGRLVVPTDATSIPAFDVLATDPWPASDPPAAARLVYNPLTTPLTLTVSAAGLAATGVYNITDSTAAAAAGKTAVIATGVAAVNGTVSVRVIVPADWAVLLEFRLASAGNVGVSDWEG